MTSGNLRDVALDVLGQLEVLVGCHRTFAAASDLAESIRKLRAALSPSAQAPGGDVEEIARVIEDEDGDLVILCNGWTICKEPLEWRDVVEGRCKAINAAVAAALRSRAVDVTEERERLAKMIEEYAMEREPGTERVILYFAANDVRRGRRLTNAERIENLAKAMEPEDKELADRIRSRAALTPRKPESSHGE